MLINKFLKNPFGLGSLRYLSLVEETSLMGITFSHKTTRGFSTEVILVMDPIVVWDLVWPNTRVLDFAIPIHIGIFETIFCKLKMKFVLKLGLYKLTFVLTTSVACGNRINIIVHTYKNRYVWYFRKIL